MRMPERRFPTLRDVRDALSELVELGLGEQPAQVLVVPDSTLQAIAMASGHDVERKPALMIEVGGQGGRRRRAVITSVERIYGSAKTVREQ